MDKVQITVLGQAIRTLGYVGTGLNGYKLYLAVSDGNITTRDVLSGISFGLSVVTLVPGVGTAIGLGGQTLLAVGSLVIGLASDNVQDNLLFDFKSR